MTHEDMIGLADEYYIAARSLQWFSAANYPTTFVGHHALELYLKAICLKASGAFNNNCHDLDKLYAEALVVNQNINHPDVQVAITNYVHYDQISRYTSKGYKNSMQPRNNSVGTNSLQSLDAAVLILRNLKDVTPKGLDRIIVGKSQAVEFGIEDPHLSLNSFILFYNNTSFRPVNIDYLKKIDFGPPRFRYEN